MLFRVNFFHLLNFLPQPVPVLTREGRKEGIAALIVVLITAVVWGSVIWGSFQYDDYSNVITDPATTEWPVFLQRLFSGIRPLTRASYFLNQAVWGMSASGFLFINLILHVFTTVGVFQLARCRLLSVYAAMVVALVFAFQPAHAETVAYVSGRSTGLMACLLVWALVVHDRAENRTSWLAVSLFVAACLAKEVALVFPAFVLIWEITRSDSSDQKKPHLKGVILYIAVAVAALAVMATSPRFHDLIEYSLALRPPVDNLIIQLRAVPATLALWFRPDTLTVDHGFALDASTAETFGGGFVLIGLAGFAMALYRRAPAVTLAIGWALLALVPTHSIIARLDVVTEKPLYLGWVGFALLAGNLWQWTATVIKDQLYRSILIGALAVVMLIAATECINRMHVWSNDQLLWTEAVEKNPASSRAWNNLGLALISDQPELAASAFVKALELDSDNKEAAENLLYSAWWEDR